MQHQIVVKREGDILTLEIPLHILVQMDDATLERVGTTIADGLKRRRDNALANFAQTMRAGSNN